MRIGKRSAAHRVAAEGLRCQRQISRLATRSLGSKCRGTRRFAMMIVSQCFCADKRRGVMHAVVVYLAIDGRP